MKKNVSKSEVNAQKILKFIEANPKCEVKTVIEKTGINRTSVYNIMADLKKEGKLVMTNRLYSVVEAPAKLKKKPAPSKPKAVKAEPAPEPVEEVVVEVKEEKIETVAETAPVNTDEEDLGKNFGRDFSKLIFNGVEYRKGKYVLALLQAFVEKNPKTTYAKLEEAFPPHLVRTFGVFKKTPEARKINLTGKQRYFGRRDQIIELACGTHVSVTNQISRDNLPGIIEAAKKVGVL